MTSATYTPVPQKVHLSRSLWGVLLPQRIWIAVVIGLVSLALGIIARSMGLPLWRAVLPGTILFGSAVIIRWYYDRHTYGALVALIIALMTFQGGHGIEHVAQWIQYHILGYTLRVSTGLISAADTELVHFVWNWGVLLVMIRLVWLGMRNPWAWIMLIWSIAHTGEHSYLYIRHLMVLDVLNDFGQTSLTAQGLPGIFGRDGWLARSPVTAGTWVCTIPGLTTATRLDVHFWWNVGETALLAIAAQTHLSRQRTHSAR